MGVKSVSKITTKIKIKFSPNEMWQYLLSAVVFHCYFVKYYSNYSMKHFAQRLYLKSL